jgi:hypothetical protein
MNLQHGLPDGGGKLSLALKSLGVSMGAPACHDVGREIGADAPHGSLRVPDGLGDLAERWGRESVLVHQGLDPLSDGGVIVAVAGRARPFGRWDDPRCWHGQVRRRGGHQHLEWSET